MMHAYHHQPAYEDRYLLVDDSDEDACQILSVLCEHSASSASDFADFLTASCGGRA